MPNVRQHAEQQQQQQSAMEDSDDDMRNELGLPSAASTATVKPVGQVGRPCRLMLREAALLCESATRLRRAHRPPPASSRNGARSPALAAWSRLGTHLARSRHPPPFTSPSPPPCTSLWQGKDLKYTTMFAAVDADSDGAIDVDELITGLRKLGMLAKTKAEAQQLLDRFGNGASPSLRRSLLRKPLIYRPMQAPQHRRAASQSSRERPGSARKLGRRTRCPCDQPNRRGVASPITVDRSVMYPLPACALVLLLRTWWPAGQGFVEQAGFVELAKHVEYESLFDTDGDGELGALERIMMKYDADKSGEFSVREVKKIVDDLQNEKKQACS